MLNQYFELDGIQTKVQSIQAIDSFEDFKIVCEDIDKHKDELGIDGVFASTSFAIGEEWRWSTHLFNYALYYEYKERNIDDTNDLKLDHFDGVKNNLDLYVKYSIKDVNELGDVTVNDSIKEFANGKCIFMQNGNWAWDQINNVESKVVSSNDIALLPIYTGNDNESNLGICIGTQSYFAINKFASKEDIKASIKFLTWLTESEKGNDLVVNKLKFISPFSTCTKLPSNPLAKEVISYYSSNNDNVTWEFITIPSEDFKLLIAKHLYNYIIGNEQWDNVKKSIIENWNKEKNSIQE